LAVPFGQVFARCLGFLGLLLARIALLHARVIDTHSGLGQTSPPHEKIFASTRV
jgi:hypothetical protein